MSVGSRDTRYRIEKEYDEDGLGTLQLCVEQKSQNLVLFRRIRPELFVEPDRLGKFQRRIERLSKVQIMGVLQIRSTGVFNSEPWVVTDGTQGETLRERLERGRLGARKSLRVLRSVAESLDELHRQGYIYGRLQPESLFFDEDDNLWLEEFATLSALCAWDSGKFAIPSHLQVALPPRDYRAPEIFAEGKTSAKADQFSLTTILCECLTGMRSSEFLLDQEPELVLSGDDKIKTQEASRLALLRKAKLSLEVVEVLLKGLAGDPNARYENCLALIDAAEAVRNRAKARKQRKLRTAALSLLALVACYFAFEFWVQTARQSRIRKIKLEKANAVAQRYETDIKSVIDLPLAPALKNLQPEDTSEADQLLTARRTKSQEVRKQEALSKTQFEAQMSRFRRETKVDFLVTLSDPPVRSTEADPEQANVTLVLTGGTVVAKGRPSSKVNWSAKVDVSPSAPPPCDVQISARLTGAPIWQAVSVEALVRLNQSGRFEPAGRLTVPMDAWQRGDAFTFEVVFKSNTGNHEWKSAKSYTLGLLTYTTKRMSLKPDQVFKAGGYSVGTGIHIGRRDLYEVVATGDVIPFEDNFYKKYFSKTKAEPIDPAGKFSSLARQDFVLVESDYYVAALLLKVASNPKWQRAVPSRISREEGAGGELLLSINSVKGVGKQAASKNDLRHYWKSSLNKSFEVTIRRWSFTPDSLSLSMAQPSTLKQLVGE